MTSTGDVLEWLQRYAAAWRENRVDAIAAQWDRDAFLFYKAEESLDYFHHWDQLEAYWRQNERLHDRVVLRFCDPVSKPIADDLLMVAVKMRWDIRFAADARLPDGSPFMHRGRSMGGDNHVLIMLRDGRPDQRLVAWCETPDAPITYLRELYFKQADACVLD
jgi:hypothetical protein